MQLKTILRNTRQPAQSPERIIVNRVILVTLVAAAAAAVFAGAAAAAGKDFRSDPRKCTLNNPAQCGAQSATTALRVTMSARDGHPWKPGTSPEWNAQIKCTPVAASRLLKWRCSYQGATGVAGNAVVWFRALATGWHRTVTVTPAP
jgi:hypothetical protein